MNVCNSKEGRVAIPFARRKEQLRYQTKLESIDLKATILQCLAKTLTKMKLRTLRVAKYIIWGSSVTIWGLDCFFSTHFPGHESQNLEFCLRPNFGQDHPPLVENVLVAIFFYQEASSREESCWDWFQMTKPSWSIECYFSLEFKRHKGDLCPQGGEVFRGSWMRGEIGKLFITPFISTSQIKRRGSLNVWDAFKSFNLLKNWRVLMYFVLLEILDSKLWLQKTFQLLSA